MGDQREDRDDRQYSDDDLQDLVTSSDSGARAPVNRATAMLIAGTAMAWSLFQLWIAQPQLWFGAYLPVLNSSQTRPIHLMFAIFLAFLAYPAFKSSPRERIPLIDWGLALVGAFCTGLAQFCECCGQAGFRLIQLAFGNRIVAIELGNSVTLDLGQFLIGFRGCDIRGNPLLDIDLDGIHLALIDSYSGFC